MDEDYINYKSGKGFAFLHYPFVLRPHVKSVGLQFDNRLIRWLVLHSISLGIWLMWTVVTYLIIGGQKLDVFWMLYILFSEVGIL